MSAPACDGRCRPAGRPPRARRRARSCRQDYRWAVERLRWSSCGGEGSDPGLEIERHNAVVLERGAEPVDGVAHVLAGDAIELLDQAVGGVVEDVVVALHRGRVIGLDVAAPAVGTA